MNKNSPPTNRLLMAALNFVAQGLPVIPLHSPVGSGCSCQAGASCSSPAKHPRTPHGLKDASVSPDQIAIWWARHPTANVGVCTGGPMRLVVLDVDGDVGRASLERLRGAVGGIPDTMQVWTGSGGAHLWFQGPVPCDVRNKAGVPGYPGLDLRADGGYVVAPPSRHVSGETYRWEAVEGELAALPEALYRIFVGTAGGDAPPARGSPSGGAGGNGSPVQIRGATTQYGRAAIDSEVSRILAAAEGVRNDTLNSAAYALGQLVAGGEIAHQDAENALFYAGTEAGLTTAETTKTLKSGLSAGAEHPRAAPPRQDRGRIEAPRPSNLGAKPEVSTPRTTGGATLVTTTDDENPIEFRSLLDLRRNPPPPPDEVVGRRLIIAGTIAMLSGPPKSLKTWLVNHLALRIAGGLPAFGEFPVAAPQPVAIISYEGGMDLTYERLDRMARAMGLPDAALESVHIWNPETTPPDFSDPRSIAYLQERVLSFPARPRFLVVDPLIEAHTADENSTKEMAAIVRSFRNFAKHMKMATMLAHHTTKAAPPGRPDPMAARGSTVLYGAVATALAVKGQKVAGHNGVRMSYRLRYGQSPDDAYLYLDPATLDVVASVAPATRKKVTGRVLYDFLKTLHDGATASLEDAQQALGVSDDTLRRLRATGKKDGWLIEEKSPPTAQGGGAVTMKLAPEFDWGEDEHGEAEDDD